MASSNGWQLKCWQLKWFLPGALASGCVGEISPVLHVGQQLGRDHRADHHRHRRDGVGRPPHCAANAQPSAAFDRPSSRDQTQLISNGQQRSRLSSRSVTISRACSHSRPSCTPAGRIRETDLDGWRPSLFGLRSRPCRGPSPGSATMSSTRSSATVPGRGSHRCCV